MRRRLILALIASFALPSTAFSEGKLAQVREAGIVRIGFANDAPWSFAKSDGTLAGVDHDIATLVFARLGINTLEGVLNKFGALVPGLQADRFDVLASGFYIRPARCEQVKFSMPTVAIGDGMIVRSGNPKKIDGYTSVVSRPDIKLGAVIGAATMKNAMLAGVPESQILTFSDNISVVAAVRAGRVDGALMTAATAQTIVSEAGDASISRALPFEAAVIDGKPVVNYAGFAFRKQDSDLAAAFDKELATIIGTPEHVKILERYGLSRNELPSPQVTTTDLCKS
jgi:polar amino acid transport system substrate-binding protein